MIIDREVDRSQVRLDIDDQIREAWTLTKRLEGWSLSELQRLWAEHRPREPFPGREKAPGKLAVSMLEKGAA